MLPYIAVIVMVTAINESYRLIVIVAMQLITTMLRSLTIRRLVFQLHVPNAIPQIPDGSLLLINSTTRNIFPSIQENIRGFGQVVQNVIQLLQKLLPVLTVTTITKQTPTAVTGMWGDIHITVIPVIHAIQAEAGEIKIMIQVYETNDSFFHINGICP